MNVGIFLYEDVELLDFGGPGEVFAVASLLHPQAGIRVFSLALSRAMLTSQGFLRIEPEFDIDHCPPPDLIVLPGGTVTRLLDHEKFLNWLRKLVDGGATALSVCTGAFLLARAGLLDGLKATTWYGRIDQLREMAPNAEILTGQRFIDNGRIITTAGVSAGIDGALHAVARFLGERAALDTAHYMEYDGWKPGRGLVVDPGHE